MNHTERISLRDAVRYLPGIGEKRAALFAKLGVVTLRDLLYCFPRAYQNRGDIRQVVPAAKELEKSRGEVFRAILTGELENTEENKPSLSAPPAAYLLTVGSRPTTARIRGRLTLTKFSAFDESGTCGITYFNQSYAADRFKPGQTYRFWGRLSSNGGRPSLASPEAEPVLEGETLPPLTPVYRLTAGLNGRQIASAVASALKSLGAFADGEENTGKIPDILPQSLKEKYRLLSRAEALRRMHFPSCSSELKEAQETLFFEEVYLFTLGLLRAGEGSENKKDLAPKMRSVSMQPFCRLLPFELTDAQKKAVEEIMADMCAGTGPMKRMLSGDVGSGKTVVAAAAVYLAAKNGYQSALMAPTEILASQHYDDLKPIFDQCGITCALLTGSTKQSERKKILAALSAGSLALIIGTHALLGDGVEFARPGLVVTDEQHRFGVMQRAALGEKTSSVTADGLSASHMLVMSATPIPRSLALILYRDLSLSVLDAKPAGRQKVDTFVVDEGYRERLNGFVKKNVSEGHQVYVICPSVRSFGDEDEEPDGRGILSPYEAALLPPLSAASAVPEPPKNVTDWSAKLSKDYFPEIPVGCLHGKMKGAEKEDVMRRFASGEIKILVSTTVVEVGVNVPNATLMIIENAERFGLSQLHQLRGRVGRGDAKSWCILVSGCAAGSAAAERLNVLKQTSDGFEIARRDLELRGPGDFFPKDGEEGGIRQHGGFEFKLAESCASADLLKAAADEAAEVLKLDPYLKEEENLPAAAEADRAFGRAEVTVS